MPESKMPMGERIHRMRIGNHDAAADAAGHGLQREIGGKVGEVARDVRLEAREQVVEREQHQPVLVLPALVLGARRSRCAGGSASSCRVLRLIPSVVPSQAMKMPAVSFRPSLAWPQPGNRNERQKAFMGLMRRASVSARGRRRGPGGVGRGDGGRSCAASRAGAGVEASGSANQEPSTEAKLTRA